MWYSCYSGHPQWGGAYPMWHPYVPPHMVHKHSGRTWYIHILKVGTWLCTQKSEICIQSRKVNVWFTPHLFGECFPRSCKGKWNWGTRWPTAFILITFCVMYVFFLLFISYSSFSFISKYISSILSLFLNGNRTVHFVCFF